MPLRFVLDEHLRVPIWEAIVRHNSIGLDPIDAIRVGDHTELTLGTSDPELLIWAENAGRLIISRDRRTLPRHFRNHLASGRHSPGLLLLRRRVPFPQVVLNLAL